MADMQDLGSCAARRVGSSPTFRIIIVTVVKLALEGKVSICALLPKK